MRIKLNPEFTNGRIVGVEDDLQKETSALLRAASISASVSDLYKEFQEREVRQKAEIQTLAKEALAHQNKCSDDAEKLLSLYWGGDDKRHSIEIGKMRDWLVENQPLDRWFFVRLIEAAGQKALELGYSQHKADIARAKNARPRAWVCSAWDARTDKGQSKAAFSRQYAQLVKSRFNLIVTPETIARGWLLKGRELASV
jgi:hypothetical protein